MSNSADYVCVVCQSRDTNHVHQIANRQFPTPVYFYIAKCRNCGTYFLSPLLEPDVLVDYYPIDYPPYSGITNQWSISPERLAKHHGLMRRYNDAISFARNTGTLLDIGCATGDFLNEMRHKGWKCKGIETNPQIADFAKKRFGLDIHTGDLQSSKMPDGSFDLITLWDVFEHVYKPTETIQKIVRLLRPGGRLIVRVPNPECWEARIFMQNWAGWDAPRHLQLLPRKTICDLFEKSGLHISRMTSSTGRFALFALSLQYVIEEHFRFGRINKILKGIAHSVFLRMAMSPYFRLTDHIGQTSLMTVFAQKPL